MRKRYIICIDKSTDKQQEEFVDYLQKSDLSWWHWIANTWLIIDNNNSTTASKLRDIVGDIFPGENNLVFEFNESSKGTWAGFGPSTDDRNMFNWIKKNW